MTSASGQGRGVVRGQSVTPGLYLPTPYTHLCCTDFVYLRCSLSCASNKNLMEGDFKVKMESTDSTVSSSSLKKTKCS